MRIPVSGRDGVRSHNIVQSFRSTPMTSAALIGVLALTFYLRLLYFEQIIDGDVGNMAYAAWRMAEGEVLIDLEGPGKPPLSAMLYGLFIRLFGPSVLGVKIFGALFVLLAVVSVFWVAKQAYGKRIGLLAALLFGVFSSGPIIEGGTVNLETIMHLPYALAIGLFIKAAVSGRLRWYFLTGVAAIAATLVKQVGGVLFFVFLCYGIGECFRTKTFHSTARLRSYAVLCAGALLPAICVAAFYHVHGYTLDQLYHSMLGSNLQYIRRGHDYTSLFSFFFWKLRIMLPENGFLWAGSAFAAVCLGSRIRRGEGSMADRTLLWWAFWSFAVLWISGTFFYHYFLQLVAPFSVLTAFGMSAAWKGTKSLRPLLRRSVQGAEIIVLVIGLVIFVRTDYKYFFSYGPVEKTLSQIKIAEGVFDEYGIRNLTDHEIARYIQDHTNPSESIYVWGIAPQIYFLAQRRAATRYRNNFNMSVLVTNDPLKALREYAPAVMDDLRKSRPVYVVQIFRLEDFPGLEKFVREGYRLDGTMELSIAPYTISLYRRDDDPKMRGKE